MGAWVKDFLCACHDGIKYTASATENTFLAFVCRILQSCDCISLEDSGFVSLSTSCPFPYFEKYLLNNSLAAVKAMVLDRLRPTELVKFIMPDSSKASVVILQNGPESTVHIIQKMRKGPDITTIIDADALIAMAKSSVIITGTDGRALVSPLRRSESTGGFSSSFVTTP